ncbi:MAG TPA: FAD-dependent oxidoreductase, partial [Longimicrobiaceae bacterium]|nr:FAD-dependent oxidoreductase [Longimicrobiaceae bacterium]
LVAAEAHGAVLRTGERVVRWNATPDGVAVRTDRSSYVGGALVIAAGPWVRELAPAVVVEVERQVMLWFAPRYAPASLSAQYCPVFLFETPAGTFYGVPDLGGGVKAARHHGGEITTVEAMGNDLREEDVQPVTDFLDRHVPAAPGQIRRGAVCRYTNTAGQAFVIDRLPDEERVWVVSACSGHGFKFASGIGEAVGQLVLEGKRRETLEPFRWPDQGPPTA